MRLRWTAVAAADLEEISNYLRHRHPAYWQPTVRKLYDGICSLKRFPDLGRPGREEGTRELLFLPLPYVAVYRTKDDAIQILRIYHSSRNL